MADVKLFPLLKLMIFDHASKTILQLGKTRIDGPVEDMFFERVDHRALGVHPHRFGQSLKEIVDEKWKARDVVEMSVREHNIANIFTLLFIYRGGKTSSIKCDAAVYDEARKMLPF